MTLLDQRNQLDELMFCFTYQKCIDRAIIKRDCLETILFAMTTEEQDSFIEFF